MVLWPVLSAISMISNSIFDEDARDFEREVEINRSITKEFEIPNIVLRMNALGSKKHTKQQRMSAENDQ